MGAYAPAPLVTPQLLDTIENTIIKPTIDGMASEGIPYKGLLYTGIVVTQNGPKVLEYNCRFGDPETQAVLPLLDGDLADIMLACSEGELHKTQVDTTIGSALCVVIASGGYPGAYTKGYPVYGIEEAENIEDVKVFHAGTVMMDNTVVTSGGRVLGVTGWGDTFEHARKHAYDAVAKIHFKDAFFRSDIGNKALNFL
jgi:phosphoribosylamine--glycine ligase